MRTLILFILLGSFFVDDYSYEKLNIKRTKPRAAKISVDGLNDPEIYILDDVYYLVGYFGIESSGSGAYGPQLIVKDKEGKRLYASKPRGDGFVWPPVFFKAKRSTAPVIIMLPDGMEQPTGCNVYMFKDGSIKELGYMSAAVNLGYEHTHLPKYTAIEYKEGNYLFTFNTTHITQFKHDGSGEAKQIHLDGKKVRYVYDGKELKFEQL